MPLQNKYKETNNKYFENLSEKLNEKGVRNNEFKVIQWKYQWFESTL